MIRLIVLENRFAGESCGLKDYFVGFGWMSEASIHSIEKSFDLKELDQESSVGLTLIEMLVQKKCFQNLVEIQVYFDRTFCFC